MDGKGIIVLVVIALLFIGPTIVLYDFESLTEKPDPELSDSEILDGVPPPISYDQFSNLGSYFTENRGQKGEGAGKYYAQGEPLSVAFGTGWVAYHLRSDEGSGVLIRITFKDAQQQKPEGQELLGRSTNYFMGNNPERWTNNVRSFSKIQYEDLWHDIDLRFYFKEGRLKYEFIIGPDGNPNDIVLQYDGLERLTIDSGEGNLLIYTSIGILHDEAPFSFQSGVEGIITVPSRFTIKDKETVSFDVGPYDETLPLTIDPGLSFSTFIGGSSYEFAFDSYVDSSGCTYVTGETRSSDFPTTTGAYNTTPSDNLDCYILKLNSVGTGIEYSTFLGGNRSDKGHGIWVDKKGCAYIAGYTVSTDFPTTTGAYDTSSNGNYDCFVTKLSANGTALEYSTYLGGDSRDWGYDIFVDTSGCAFITGDTVLSSSINYPTTAGAFDTSHNGGEDCFVTKLNATGGALLYSTYLGGWNDERGNGIYVDSTGNAFITGETDNVSSSFTPFPSTPGAFDTSHNGYVDCFITKLNDTGAGLIYSTYLGGNQWDKGNGIWVDPSGYAYITGLSYSADFPTTTGAYDTSNNGKYDCFVTKLNASGASLNYSTLIGGSENDYGYSICVNSSGCAYVTGETKSTDFPTTAGANDTTHNGNDDCFVVKFNATGTALEYSTYLGGNETDGGYCVFLDSHESAYITGWTKSMGFPTTPGAYNTSHNGDIDIFVVKLKFLEDPTLDSDNDGVIDSKDAFPNNPYEYKDTDGDGIGDNLDPDADGDGTPDERDAFPLDKTETLDTDWDGTGDNTDKDDDNDGINDTSDAFPKNPREFKDSDGDGIGDNLDLDDDNDGTSDEQEMYDAISREFTTLTNVLSTLQSTLEGDLDGMNRSLQTTISDLESGFLDELRGVNASLADDIQDALDAISGDVSDLGTTVTGDIDDMEAWLDQLLTALDAELARTNASLHGHMDDMDTRMEGFYQSLSKDLADAIYLLAQVESNLSSGNEDIQADIATLSEMTSNINEHSLSELSALLESLAEDISSFDEETGARLQGISSNIMSFEASTSDDLDEIDTTLKDLEKMNDIMNDLEKLDQDLDAAKDELCTSVQDASDEQLGKSNLNIALIAIALILLIVILVIILRSRKVPANDLARDSEED